MKYEVSYLSSWSNFLPYIHSLVGRGNLPIIQIFSLGFIVPVPQPGLMFDSVLVVVFSKEILAF